MTTSGQIDQQNSQNRYELRNRYVFRGNLVMETALHIGGGKATLSSSDSPVVLTPDQKPFIPGSSFKGALRSTVEKIVSNLPGLWTCSLIELSNEELQEEREQGRKICSTARQGEITREKREHPERAATFQKEAIDGLCSTCRLFGSPFTAARLNVNDLYMPKEEWSGVVQTRDGVAIDRDSEKAKDRLKYDFEVVPASTSFFMEIVLENATQQDLQMICAGLSEYEHGFGVIGGKRSRGLGVSRLEGLKVFALELIGDNVDIAMRNQRLRDYLISGQYSDEIDGPEFLAKHIESIFE
jgi:CRISPR-associated RAMP protein (TIGR02581 family)